MSKKPDPVEEPEVDEEDEESDDYDDIEVGDGVLVVSLWPGHIPTLKENIANLISFIDCSRGHVSPGPIGRGGGGNCR